VLDLRRPDELIKYGSFPVFLNVQNKDLEKHLAYCRATAPSSPSRTTRSAAGRRATSLRPRGFTVAGATGSEDYEQEGGKAVAHIQSHRHLAWRRPRPGTEVGSPYRAAEARRLRFSTSVIASARLARVAFALVDLLGLARISMARSSACL
jgi:hypothetical protein